MPNSVRFKRGVKELSSTDTPSAGAAGRPKPAPYQDGDRVRFIGVFPVWTPSTDTGCSPIVPTVEPGYTNAPSFALQGMCS
jgi:hypothetical protein